MKRNSAVPGDRYSALIELLRTAENLWNASRVFFARWDLSPSQFNILNLLHELPHGCSQSDLGRQLIMHRSNVTGLIDRLESRGLVQRKENAQDRRAFNIVLTTEGAKLVRQILPFYYKAAETVWGDIPASRAQQLVAELAVVNKNAEQISQTVSPR